MIRSTPQNPHKKQNMKCRQNRRVKVTIDTHGFPVAVGLTRDISIGGIFVETSYQSESAHQIIDIEFVACNSEKTEVYRVRAKVVHCNSKGLGFKIDDFNPESRLPKLLLHKKEIQQRINT